MYLKSTKREFKRSLKEKKLVGWPSKFEKDANIMYRRIKCN